jgi:NADPH-dependent 2,4-dienoyl-CoA reductase/sulfur reductase-like enzyme
MCWGRRSRDYWISCLVNPSVGREFQWGGDRFAPATAPKHVLVVGGGPAGLEVARVAAERGHRVTLAEASDKLGGQFRLAGLQPRRANHRFLDWLEGQLQRLQVEIKRNTYLDTDGSRPWTMTR